MWQCGQLQGLRFFKGVWRCLPADENVIQPCCTSVPLPGSVDWLSSCWCSWTPENPYLQGYHWSLSCENSLLVVAQLIKILMGFRFMLMAPQPCQPMKEKQALENFMVIPAFHDILFCFYATGMVSFHLMRHLRNFFYWRLLYFCGWWTNKFVDIVYVSVSYHLSILTATPEGCRWCGRQKAKSGVFRKIQKKRRGWTAVFRYWHWKGRRMWNLHGDEQQDSLA